MSEETEVPDDNVCAFFKPRVRKKSGLRERQLSSDESDNESSAQRSERKKRNGLVQSTSGSKKWKSEAKSFEVVFDSTAQKSGPSDQGATAVTEIDTELDKDARSIFERAQKINEEMKGKDDDKVYRGINNYAQYITKKDTAAGSAAKMKAKGPMRAPTNVRSTVRWDYQPDVCKDYKETGFCGFGDSCIFMHDRGDYKHGWQLDREWEATESAKKHKKIANHGENIDGFDDDRKYEIPSDEDELPFACFICRKEFSQPIVTKCEHYFCEKCALAHFRKSKQCFVCSRPTGGVFNPATVLAAKLEAKKKTDACKSQTEQAQEQSRALEQSIKKEADDSSPDEIPDA